MVRESILVRRVGTVKSLERSMFVHCCKEGLRATKKIPQKNTLNVDGAKLERIVVQNWLL